MRAVEGRRSILKIHLNITKIRKATIDYTGLDNSINTETSATTIYIRANIYHFCAKIRTKESYDEIEGLCLIQKLLANFKFFS